MEIEGSINSGTMEFEVDIDDLKQHLEIMDTDDIEQYVSDFIDNHDWTNQINVDDQVEALLDVYEGNSSPCSIGQIFEKAVWWAMGRRPPSDVVDLVPREVSTDTDGNVVVSEEVIRRIVAEELKKILLGACNLIPVQEHIDASNA